MDQFFKKNLNFNSQFDSILDVHLTTSWLLLLGNFIKSAAFLFSKWDSKRQQFFCLYYSIVGRGFLIPPTLPGPIVFQILSNPPLLATSTALFVTLFLWQNGSTHAKPWYLGTRRNLMCAFSTRFQVYWCLKLNVVFGSTLIWYHKDTQHP